MWSWKDWLLLSLAFVQSAQFCESEVSTWRTCNFPWPYLWFLSQISLWVEHHWTVLGCCQVPLLWVSQLTNNHWQDGEVGVGVFRQCSPSSNPVVSNLFHCFLIFSTISDMPTKLHGSWMDMWRVWQVLMLYGPIRSIKDIVFCPQSS